MYVLDSISKKLPGVFKSVERELEIKMRKSIKKKL
jgi:hypothetical protein